MNQETADEWLQALRPIASLISKSEKAQQKLKPGTWQHTMLRDQLKALAYASALINRELSGQTTTVAQMTGNDLRELILIFAAIITKTEQAFLKLSSGSSQHTLLQNRRKALHIGQRLIKRQLAQGDQS